VPRTPPRPITLGGRENCKGDVVGLLRGSLSGSELLLSGGLKEEASGKPKRIEVGCHPAEAPPGTIKKKEGPRRLHHGEGKTKAETN